VVTVITGAFGGDAGFALANPIGGIALQTVWWRSPTWSIGG
jgi:cation:H+ antiporter